MVDNILSSDIDFSALEAFKIMIFEKLGVLPYFLWKIILAIIVFFVGSLIIKVVRKFVAKIMNKAGADIGLQQFFDAFVKFALYFLLLSGILISFGVATSSIAALIGTVGLTIGLSMQGSLSNLAGGILILLLKPFSVGDTITEDTHNNTGMVSEIHLLYTKLLTLEQDCIIIPNGTLANTSLKNTGTSAIKRLDLSIDVAYNSDIKKVKDTLKSICENHVKVLKDKEIDVFVKDLKDSSILMACRFYVNNADFFNVKADILENILIQFNENDIKIPYPTMDINQFDTKM